MEHYSKPNLYTKISRRTFIESSVALAGLSGILSACERPSNHQRKPTIPQTQSANSNAEKYMTQTEIRQTAQAMQKDPELRNVQYAGWLLEGNNYGQPTISKTSLMFRESTLRIKSVPHLRTGWRPGEEDIPAIMIASGRTVNDQYELKSRETGIITTGRGVQYFIDHIALSEVHMSPNRWNDFKSQFYLSKELINIAAFEMMGKYLATSEIYPKYEQPTDPKQRALIQANLLLNSSIKNVDSTEIADLWAHFILIPDYLKATEKQKWTKQTAESPEMSVFFHAAEKFRTENILTLSNGIYQWTNDTDKLYQSWLRNSIEK